jgi:hypothetical protein
MRWDRVWLRGWRSYALLAGLCLALYVPGIAAIPPLDRDEARFAAPLGMQEAWRPQLPVTQLAASNAACSQ